MKYFTAVLLTLSFLIFGASAQAATIQDLQATIQTLRTTISQLRNQQDISRVKLAACTTKTCILNYQGIIEARHNRIVYIINRISTIQTRIAVIDSAEAARIAAQAAAVEAARIAAVEAARIAAVEAARIAAVEAARIAAVEAARLAAVEAARIAAEEAANNQLTLAWAAPSLVDAVIGYYVYAGESETDTSQLLTDLTDFVISSPSYSVDKQRDLQVTSSGRTCFRVKAYSNTTVSDFSNAVCTG